MCECVCVCMCLRVCVCVCVCVCMCERNFSFTLAISLSIDLSPRIIADSSTVGSTETEASAFSWKKKRRKFLKNQGPGILCLSTGSWMRIPSALSCSNRKGGEKQSLDSVFGQRKQKKEKSVPLCTDFSCH